MNCIKCGNELPNGASFCTACGTPQPKANETPLTPQANNEVRPPEIYIDPTPAAPAESVGKPKKKGGFLKVLIALVLVLAFVTGVTVMSYYTFLPAKYTLMVAEYSNVLKSYETLDKNMARYEERVVKPVYEGTVQKQSEFGISIDNALLEQFGIPSETVELIANGLKTIKINYGYAVDARNKKQTVNFGVSPLVTLNMFFDKTKFGLSIPELTNKTLVGDLKELDKLAEVYPDIDPYLLETYKNMDPWMSTRVYDEIKIDRTDIKKVMLDYSKEIIDSIDSRDMSIKRGQKTEVLGNDISCQEITIELDREAQAKVLSNILKRLEDDDNVYNLTVGNFLKLFEIMNENGMYDEMLQGVDIEDELSKDNYKGTIADMRENLDEEALPEEVIVKVYIKGLDVVKYEFSFEDEQVDDLLVTVEELTDGLSFEQRYVLSGNADGESMEIALNMKKDYDEASDTTDFNMDLTVDANMPDNSGNVTFTLESIEKPEGKSDVEHTVNAALKVDVDSYGTPTQGDITLSVNGSKTRNSKGLPTSSDYKGDISVNVPGYLPQAVKVGFGVSTETAYGEKVTIPEPDEVLDISKATQEDYEELMNEINEKIGPMLMMLYGF